MGKKLYPSQPEEEGTTRLMWRLRPFLGGQWVVFPTTKACLEYLTEEMRPGISFEVQVVEMDQAEYDSLPEQSK